MTGLKEAVKYSETQPAIFCLLAAKGKVGRNTYVPGCYRQKGFENPGIR